MMQRISEAFQRRVRKKEQVQLRSSLFAKAPETSKDEINFRWGKKIAPTKGFCRGSYSGIIFSVNLHFQHLC
jgi:hypothetical protein